MAYSLLPAQLLTCDSQLSHKEGHSRLPLPPPRGEQHHGVSNNGENKQDPESYQLLSLWETKQHKTSVPVRTKVLYRTQGQASLLQCLPLGLKSSLSKLYSQENRGTVVLVYSDGSVTWCNLFKKSIWKYMSRDKRMSIYSLAKQLFKSVWKNSRCAKEYYSSKDMDIYCKNKLEFV